MTTQEFHYLWHERHQVLYRVELSVIYHLKREKFFNRCDKFTKVISIVGGSTVIVQLLAPQALLVIAAAITISSVASLIFNFSDKAKSHWELAKNFRQLESEIFNKEKLIFNAQDLSGWNSRIRDIEKNEKANISTLVIICQNELARAQNQPEKIVKIPFLKKFFAHLL